MPSSGRPRVVVFGVDAMDPSTLREGVEEGWLPELRALAERGTAVRLAPTSLAFPGSAWPTTTSGTEVFDHRLYLHQTLDPGSYRTVHVTSGSVRRPPLWAYVSETGHESVVVSVYGAPIVRGLRGVQVAGWGTMDPFTQTALVAPVEPPRARRELVRTTPWRLSYFVQPPQTPAAVAQYRDRLLRGIRQQEAAFARFLAGEHWQLFFGCFSETHHAGHLIWHRPGELRDVYGAVDAAVGRLVRRAPRDCTVFVVTPHGMGPNPIPGDPTDEVLARAGWLVRAPADGRNTRRDLTARARGLGRRTLPFGVRSLLKRAALRSGWLNREIPGVDWTRTRAFTTPSDLTTHVRINLAGREPDGIVPEAEFDAALDEVAQVLLELRHATSGRPAVAEVLRTDELAGAPVPFLPDLSVVWSNAEPLRRIVSDRVGEIEVEPVDPRTGHHRPDGFLLGAGPGVDAAGLRLDESGRLVDLAPTLLARLGVPRPAVFAGSPIAVFADGSA